MGKSKHKKNDEKPPTSADLRNQLKEADGEVLNSNPNDPVLTPYAASDGKFDNHGWQRLGVITLPNGKPYVWFKFYNAKT